MEFGLITCTLGPSPFVYTVRALSLAITTYLAMRFTVRICQRTLYQIQERSVSRIIALVLITTLLCFGIGFVAWIVASLIFGLTMSILIQGHACLYYVSITKIERWIPLAGSLLIFSRSLPRFLFISYFFLSLFVALIGMSVASGIEENFIESY